MVYGAETWPVVVATDMCYHHKDTAHATESEIMTSICNNNIVELE